MKNHQKLYEDVYSTDRTKNHKLNLNKISADGMDFNEYTYLFQNFLKESFLTLFDYYVRISWLRRKFVYCGRKTVLPMQNNPPGLNTNFVKYLRRIVGKDIQIITKGRTFSRIEMFFDEFFPGFLEGNPFQNPKYYRFPFKNITLDFLIVVHQLDERMELLEVADKSKMSYANFLDYVTNYILSENDTLGRDRYIIKPYDRNFPFYVRDTDKKLQPKRRTKRKI